MGDGDQQCRQPVYAMGFFMVKSIIIEKMLLEYPIKVLAAQLDDGLHVLIVGGCKTHIGAISYRHPDMMPAMIQFPGHREAVISEHWAGQLVNKYGGTIVVECGIHYENATGEQIEQIITESGHLLQELLKQLG